MEEQYYKISDVHKATGFSKRWIQILVKKNKRIDGFEFLKYDDNGYALFKKDEEAEVKPVYKGAAELTAEEILNIDNAYVDCKGNISGIMRTTGIAYHTIRRYLLRQFKPKDQARADKGKCRKLTAQQVATAKKVFEKKLLSDVQHKVKLAVENVKKETGIEIPTRLAYKWAKAFLPAHTLKHYYSKFISMYTPHIRRDLWAEYPGLLDCIVGDCYKVDESGVWIHSGDKNYEETRATAHIVMFTGLGNNYPFNIQVTGHSITSSDVKKSMMEICRDWGRPKQWLLDNGKEFKSEEILKFLLGLYEEDEKNIHRIQYLEYESLKGLDKESAEIMRSQRYAPQGKGSQERIFRIIKDEFCAFSESYSPNQQESRKPNEKISCPAVTKTLEELRHYLYDFITNDFIKREREMFYNPDYTLAHNINQGRPKTIEEAFNIKYAKFEKDEVDTFKLAYLYADKKKITYKKGILSFVYRVTQEVMSYLPDENSIESMNEYCGQKLQCLIDPKSIYHCWVFSIEGKLLGEAFDHRFNGTKVSKEKANEYGKIKRRMIKLEKDKIKQTELLDRITNNDKENTEMKEAARKNEEEFALENENIIVNTESGEIIETVKYDDEEDDNPFSMLGPEELEILRGEEPEAEYGEQQ